MINILGNLFSLLILPLDFAIVDFTLLIKTYYGFGFVFSLIIFLEYLTAKSIKKDPNRISVKTVLNYIKSYELKDSSIISPKWKALEEVFEKKNICIKELSSDIGASMGATKTLMSSLAEKGYISRKVYVNDNAELCYIASDKYKDRINLIKNK